MKKNKLLLLLSSSLFLCSCGNAPTSDRGASSSNETEESSIVVKDIQNVTTGTTIDLKDYVETPLGESWTYELLTDSVHLPSASIEAEEAPSLEQSTKLLAIRPGRVNFKIKCGEKTKTGYFDVMASSEMSALVSTFQETVLTNYTSVKTFEVDSDYNLKNLSDGEALLYKNEDYVYHPSSYYGEMIHKKDHQGYYFQLNGVEEKYENSFRALTNASDSPLLETIFRNTYQALENYFTLDSLRYYEASKTFIGDEFAYALCYEEETKNVFLNALTNLGLSYSHTVNGTSFYTVAIAPKVENGLFSFYTLSATYSGYALTEGPYVLKGVGSTKISAVDDWVNSNSSMVYANNASINNRLDGITSYTATFNGQYEDLDGNKIDVPEYFASSLPEIHSTLKWNDRYFYSDNMNLIDGRKENKVLLENGTLNGENTVIRYVLNDEGKYVSKEKYGKDATSSYELTDWKNGQTFSCYLPLNVFRDSNWKYASIEDKGNSNYFLSGFNDSIGKHVIQYLLGGISAYPCFNDASAFYYYGEYATLDLHLGKTLTDEITGEAYTRLIDGSCSPQKYYIYHINFEITDINSTLITTPSAA